MANIVVGYPMRNSGNLYINGLEIAPGTTNLLVDLGAGIARDISNQDDIYLPAPVVINTATTGVNGLDTGALAEATFYYVYVIGCSLAANPEILTPTQVSTMASGSTILNGTVISEGTVPQPTWSVTNNYQPAGLISLSSSAPTLPEGYDMYRRVGTIRTAAGAATILPFWQAGGDNSARWMYYDAGIPVLTAGVSATYVAVSLAGAVPAIASNINAIDNVMLDVLLTPTAAGNTVNFRPTGSSSTNGNAIMSGDVAAVVHEDSIQAIAAITTGGALSVDYKVVGAVTVNVMGYVDYL
jgi:hypothetical protein